MVAAQPCQVDLDADLEQEEHDPDVGEQLELLVVGHVAGRERREAEPDGQVADDRREMQPARDPARGDRGKQDEADLEDGRRLGVHLGMVPGASGRQAGSAAASSSVTARSSPRNVPRRQAMRIATAVTATMMVDTALISGRHAEPDLRVDVERQRAAADAGVEARDDEVVERQREGDHPAGRHRRREERQRDVPERPPRRRPEVARRLLEVGVQPDRPCPDDDRHVRHAERDMRDRDLGERSLPPNSVPKNSSRLMPMTISGVTIGSRRSTSIGPRQRCLTAPGRGRAASRARPTRRRRCRHLEGDPQAPRISSFRNSVGYQSSVNPAQLKFRLSALN